MTQDVKSPRLPGGSLLAAYLDRELMIWSDRGGASHHIGDRWAAHCSQWLETTQEQKWPLNGRPLMTVRQVIRLDDIPEVSREANHYHLKNPDFLIVGQPQQEPEKACILAVDAKFAADRIEAVQVSAQVVENLITVPENGVTRSLVEAAIEAHGFDGYTLAEGAFLCPDASLTDFLLTRRKRGRPGEGITSEIIRIEPEPGTMFAGLPASQLIGMLARQDGLPVTPRENLLSAIYYFRVASACIYLWQVQHRPLFTIHDPNPPEPGVVSAELHKLATPDQSAYELMQAMLNEAEVVQGARQAVSDVANVPVRMQELRAMVAASSRGDDKRTLRALRRDIELEFKRRLYDRLGEISADDPRRLGEILDEVALAARELRSEMTDFATHWLENPAHGATPAT